MTSRGDEDLDDIFAGLAGKREAVREAARAAEAAAAVPEAPRDDARGKRRRGRFERDNVFGEEYDPSVAIDPQNARVHRFDNPSGLRVFKAHALGLGRGGGTPLCPFDCTCCF